MDEELIGQEIQTAVEPAPAPAPEETNNITLDDSGELTIPADFWGDLGNTETKTEQEPEPVQEEAKPEETQEPQYYTPQEVAEAFAAGTVDPDKLRPELKDYYEAIDASTRRNAETQRIQQQLATQQQVLPTPTFEQVTEAATILAAQNYLGISPEEFDEFDPKHAAARNMAISEIRDRVLQIQQNQVRQQQTTANVASFCAEYRQTVPEFDEVGEKYFPQWREKLTVREYQAVDAILASGDVGKLKGLFDRIVSDYKAEKGAKKAPVTPPPPVMSTSGAAQGDAGKVVDISKFGDMSPDEQAKFLIQQGLV